jgi:hypothetical protein
MSGGRAAQRSKKARRAQDTVPAEPSNALPERWLKIVALGLTAICLLGWFSTEIADTDFWWHLKTGQYIVQQHSLPVPEPFAYTTALNPPAYPGEEQVRHFNLTHEWLAQVLVYIAYLVGGFPPIILFRAALLAGMCALAGLLAGRLSKNLYVGIAAAFATASLAIEFRSDRPALVTFLFVAVFVTLLELRYALWALPPLALLWANCHGGFFLGWVVMLAYCVETLPLGKWWKRAEDGRMLWLVTACSILISGINPNGFGVLPILVRYRQSAMTATLLEWQRPYLWGRPYAFDILLYAAALALILPWNRLRPVRWVIFVALVGASITTLSGLGKLPHDMGTYSPLMATIFYTAAFALDSWRKVRPAHFALFVAFAAASLTAFRNIALIGFLAPVLIGAYLWPRVQQIIPQVHALFRRWIPRLAPLVLATAIIVGTFQGWFFQLRVGEWTIPVGAANYLLANHITGRMFNTWVEGGYLMWRLWPQQRVFIDGRALSESLNRDYQQILNNLPGPIDQITGRRAELLDRYGIQVVVMNTIEWLSGGLYPLTTALGRPESTEWQLVYDDAQSLIFLRNPPPGTPVLSNKIGRALVHMDTECESYIEHSPDTPFCGRFLFDFWMRSQQPGRARHMLQLYLSHAPERDPMAEEWWRRYVGGPLPQR